jgi:hypothetical protein
MKQEKESGTLDTLFMGRSKEQTIDHSRNASEVVNETFAPSDLPPTEPISPL